MFHFFASCFLEPTSRIGRCLLPINLSAKRALCRLANERIKHQPVQNCFDVSKPRANSSRNTHIMKHTLLTAYVEHIFERHRKNTNNELLLCSMYCGVRCIVATHYYIKPFSNSTKHKNTWNKQHLLLLCASWWYEYYLFVTNGLSDRFHLLCSFRSLFLVPVVVYWLCKCKFVLSLSLSVSVPHTIWIVSCSVAMRLVASSTHQCITAKLELSHSIYCLYHTHGYIRCDTIERATFAYTFIVAILSFSYRSVCYIYDNFRVVDEYFCFSSVNWDVSSS